MLSSSYFDPNLGLFSSSDRSSIQLSCFFGSRQFFWLARVMMRQNATRRDCSFLCVNTLFPKSQTGVSASVVVLVLAGIKDV